MKKHDCYVKCMNKQKIFVVYNLCVDSQSSQEAIH